ncbi:spermidine synthase [Paenibacillus sp. NEAU-GSW1]|uniref:spermine/spermidine synthase domain-containing protein n=1 Tax=Paenibacillus sp. NEAU-GSW1 TaxID=2682486 RepID=UPI0012E2702E|nr:spermidine synthase [Paenibacillus sp. NEAU-GSW1]MUT66981.1 spermidine synthase [Paenibacillus sp. NEAU-GSW1]
MSPLLWCFVGALSVFILKFIHWQFWGEGFIRGYIREDQEPEGGYRIVKKYKTPTQRIALVETEGELWIYCNGDVMLSTSESEDRYAEAMMHIPMAAAEHRKKVLIIGGGGGVTTREALRYPDVESIVTVDVDEEIIQFGKHLNELVSFNNGALNHPKVLTFIDDGRRFIEKHPTKWDVIIIDVPEPSSQCPELSRLYSLEFFSLLMESLEEDGAMAVACSTPLWMPDYYWSIQATLRKAGFFTLPYHNYVLEDNEDWGFLLATKSPVAAADVRMRVSPRFMTPEKLEDMFHMPYYFAANRSKERIQTDNNTVLSDIVDKIERD